MKKLWLAALLLLSSASLASAQTTLSGITCPGAGCTGYDVTVNGTLGMQVAGTYNGVLLFERSVDGITWSPWYVTANGATTTIVLTTSTGVFNGQVEGNTSVRVRLSTYLSGSVTITFTFTAAAAVGEVDAPLLVQTFDATVPNAQVMGALASGVVYNTTTSGVQSVVVCATGGTVLAGGAPPTCRALASTELSDTATLVRTSGSYADPSWITSLAKAKVGLGNVENTALSTWAGSSSITTLGTIASGVVPWANVSKTASSLADLTTRSATDLSSGTLPLARLSGITNTEVSATAGIGWAKLDKTGSSLADLTTRSAADLSSGTLSLARLSGITDTEIAALAAIAWTKISKTGSSLADFDTRSAADLSSGTLPLARLAGITNTEVSASAGIAYSKLNLTGGVVNADVSASAAIAYSKLNLAGGVVNADVSASAAIAYSKLNLAASILNADVSASAAIAWTKISKTGSSLADFDTRTVSNLSDGSNVALLNASNTFTATPQIISNATNPGVKVVYGANGQMWMAMCSSLGDRFSFGKNATVCNTPALQIDDNGSGNASITVPGGFFTLDSTRVLVSNVFGWSSSTHFQAPGNGLLLIENSAETGFTRVILGTNDTSGISITKSNTETQLRLGDGTGWSSTSFGEYTTTPASPSNGQAWVQCTGTTPSIQCSINVRDNGVTYSQNIGAAH